MNDGSDIELSLLEGMDETLLALLHDAGIRTRRDLEGRIATAAARHRLAQELGVPAVRFRVLYYLNFLLPEERVERTFKLESRVETHIESSRRDRRRLWRVVGFLGLAVGGLLAALVFLRPPSSDPASPTDTEARVMRLESQVEALRPLGVARAEGQILRALEQLGPAPGWHGSLEWNETSQEHVELLLGDDATRYPPRAVGIVLWRLAELENAPLDSLSPAERAVRAGKLLADLPVPGELRTAWDASAVLLRQRYRSRGSGFIPLDEDAPLLEAALPWPWTAPEFLTCEELLARLESLPVREDVFSHWSEMLAQIRRLADQARQKLGARPEAWARDYWIRRGEMELAVVGALTGRGNLLPYHESSPREFLVQRKAFLTRAVERAPVSARGPLAWLLVEHEEALALVDWAAANPEGLGGVEGRAWVLALAEVETVRSEGLVPGAGVSRAVAQAVAVTDGRADPWRSERTRWEAGLRPLLMETRAGSAASVSSP